MDAILLQNLPQLLEALFHHIYAEKVAGKELPAAGTIIRDELIRSPSHAQSFDFHVPELDENSAAGLEAERELIALSRDYATEAIRLYAGQLLAARGTRRNQSNLTYRLPVEVLSTIFKFVHGDPTNSQKGSERCAPLNLSCVSRFWREVACTTPSLWTEIDSRIVDIAPLFIRRSAQLPLRVELNGEHEDRYFTESIRNLAPGADRWRSLIINRVEIASLGRELHFPAPLLEIFCLTHDRERHGGESTISSPLFGGETPRLRVVCFVGVSLPLNSTIYAGLVELDLQLVYYTQSTPSDLLQVLEACPLLERLALRQLQFQTTLGASPHSSIPLRCLEYLDLSVLDHQLSESIIGSIDVPTPVRMLWEQEYRENWWSACLPTAIPNSSGVGSLLVQCLGPFWPTIRILGNAIEDDACLLKLEFRTERPSSGHSPDFLKQFDQTSPFTSLKLLALELNGLDDTFALELFITLFDNFAFIETLSLRYNLSHLLGALVPAPGHSTPFPMLHTLQLADMHLDESIVQVVETRARRREAGEFHVRLRRVVLFQPRGDRHVVGLLKSIIEVVEVDKWVAFKEHDRAWEKRVVA
ncbi:hypothetical protein BOTBODRAFT_192761 [Botryobasidium botryosum FD-172 SS1]|uniref:F-box domain-containing protein n=1 Tax=Botryobasidium botryosum (strain FD-172 SS1) TaxID=930990 RepID=A0A067M4V3_BOTB1|nr:hypothetical protein BOTBODRAFT_192761 [Botryobasidium botryosum FD-172 SS1]